MVKFASQIPAYKEAGTNLEIIDSSNGPGLGVRVECDAEIVSPNMATRP